MLMITTYDNKGVNGRSDATRCATLRGRQDIQTTTLTKQFPNK